MGTAVIFEVKGFDNLAREINKISENAAKDRKRILKVGSDGVKHSWGIELAKNIYPNKTKRNSARIVHGKVQRYSYYTRSTGALLSSVDYQIDRDIISSEIYPKGLVRRTPKKGKKATVRNATKAFILNYGVITRFRQQTPKSYIDTVIDSAENEAVPEMQKEFEKILRERGF